MKTATTEPRTGNTADSRSGAVVAAIDFAHAVSPTVNGNGAGAAAPQRRRPNHTGKEANAMKKAKPPKEERTVWDDADVAEFFGINKKTLQRRVRHPVAGEIDPNDADPGVIGGRRFWVRDKVLALAGMKPSEMGAQ